VLVGEQDVRAGQGDEYLETEGRRGEPGIVVLVVAGEQAYLVPMFILVQLYLQRHINLPSFR
jgi:hypothetical protein